MRLEARGPRWIVGLAGVPGSGKSTLASRLAEAAESQTEPGALAILGMDGFHLTKAELRQFPDPKEAFARRGAPWTFDVPRLAERLHALREADAHEAVPWPGFQHEAGDPVEAAFMVLPCARLILVEGLYLLHRSDGWDVVSRFFDERWFLDTPLVVAMERLSRRHMAAWGMTRAEAGLRIDSNDRLNAELVYDDRVHADWRLIE